MPPVNKEDMKALQVLIQEQHTINAAQTKQLDQHGKLLEQILWCIKGSEAMNIEGIMPAQKRIEIKLNELNKWKEEITTYFTILTSRKIWRVAVYLVMTTVVGVLIFKYGIWIVYGWLKKLKDLL